MVDGLRLAAAIHTGLVGVNGPQFYKVLLHAGVLHEDGALMRHCPIPSLRRHRLDTISAGS